MSSTSWCWSYDWALLKSWIADFLAIKLVSETWGWPILLPLCVSWLSLCCFLTRFYMKICCFSIILKAKDEIKVYMCAIFLWWVIFGYFSIWFYILWYTVSNIFGLMRCLILPPCLMKFSKSKEFIFLSDESIETFPLPLF